MAERHKSFLVERGIIDQQEEVIFFYAAGLTVEEEGNVVTDRGVASYWQGEDGFHLQRASFGEIIDVQVEWSASSLKDTDIWVETEQETVALVASNDQGGDRSFVRAIQERRQTPADPDQKVTGASDAEPPHDLAASEELRP